MSVLNSIIDLIFNSIPTWNLLLIESKQMISDLNQLAADEVEKAEEIIDYGDISMDLYTDIVLITNGEEKDEELLMSKAIITDRWIKYAFYMLTEKDAVKIVAEKEAQELVNGIVELVMPGAEKIYQNAKSANLHKYNSSEVCCGYNGNYILNIDDVLKRFTPELKSKAEEKLAENESPTEEDANDNPTPVPVFERMGRYDEDGNFHPIFLKDKDQIIKENNSIPVRPDNMSDELFNKFESVFKPLTKGIKYFYNTSQYGNWCINVVTPDGMAICSYILDDGTIMGGTKVSILGRCQGANGYIDTLFVDVAKFPNIVRHILANSFYIMNTAEVNQVCAELFINQSIYHNIDFQNTPFMDDINTMRRIEKPLASCIQLIDPGMRLRFENFIDPSNFTLVSDTKCVSPLGYDNTTASRVSPDCLKLVVEGDTITKITGENGTKYQY